MTLRIGGLAESNAFLIESIPSSVPEEANCDRLRFRVLAEQSYLQLVGLVGLEYVRPVRIGADK